MKMLSRNSLITIALLCIILIMLFKTFSLGKTARLIPEKVVFLALGLTLIQLIKDIFTTPASIKGMVGRSKSFVYDTTAKKQSDLELHRKTSADLIRESNSLAWVLILPILIFFIGLIPAIFLYSFCFYRFRDNMTWAKSISISTLLLGFLYLLIDFVVRIPFYHGKLLEWLGI